MKRWMAASAFVAATALALPAFAFDRLEFRVETDDEAFDNRLKDASLLRNTNSEGRLDQRDVMATALADYRRLTEALYAEGHYGGTVNILIDGREASSIPVLRPPSDIGVVSVVVDPGPKYRFSQARVAPLAPGTVLPGGFAESRGAPAPIIEEAATAGIEGWRKVGNAKARIASERVTANHADDTIAADIGIAPGPRLRFGRLEVTTPSAVRAAAIRRIADLPVGEVFRPDEVDAAAERLRRTEAFSSVQIVEGAAAGETLLMEARVTDRKPRRIGFGAEISSLEGLMLSGFWLHRNLAGGAERFRIDGAVRNIGQNADEIDYSIGARLDVPAAIGGNTHFFAFTEIAVEEEPTYSSDRFEIGVGLSRIWSDRLNAEIAVSYLVADTKNDLGLDYYELLTFPSRITYDRRDVPLNPRNGFYAHAQATPFVGLNGTDSGARLYGDLRGYVGLGERNVFAGRLQAGSVLGSDIADTLPEFLFASGGGGTVRGQPYQSLDVDLGGGDNSGGRSFLGVSAEWRLDITDSIGLVAFADSGYIGADPADYGSGEWHSGAGLGLRYNTGIGPLRVDIAGPTGGDTGDGVQFYIGIGQAF